MKSEGERRFAARFGENLRACRHADRLSQEELSFRARLHRSEISLLERGERIPRTSTLIKLAKTLKVSPLELLDGIEWEPDRIELGGFVIENPKRRGRS
ncbi:MAG TPA: helix-turn-helix transcriptional regulator [Solirubrobacterales bacterium]|jgi:transcriptional regulator with XRE-family HTH domain